MMGTLNHSSQVILIDKYFQDFGQFQSSVENWDLDFMLLSNGGFRAGMHYSMINNCIMGKVSLDCKLEQHGQAPLGMRTFVIPENDQVHYRWRNYQIDGSTLQLFPKNGELHSISDSRFDCFVVSFPEPHFLAVSQSLGYDMIGSVFHEATVWREDSQVINTLRYWCEHYRAGNPDADDILLKLLVESLARTSQLIGHVHSRDKLIKKIAHFLLQNKFERFKIQDLVKFTGASERTIQYAFKSNYGITPMDYIKRTRLHAVCSELRTRKYSTVSDIANKYDFWHLGQFAADFKKVYGVLPSEYRRSL